MDTKIAELELAWKRAKVDQRRVFVRHPCQLILVELDLAPWFDELRDKLNGPPTTRSLSCCAPVGSDEATRVLKACKGKPADAEVEIFLLPGLRHEVTAFTSKLKPITIEDIREQLPLRPKPTPIPILPNAVGGPEPERPEGIILVGCLDYMWGDDCYRTRFCQQYKSTPLIGHPCGFFGYCNFSNDTDEQPNCKPQG